MKIIREKSDELNSTIRITIEKEDYEGRVTDVLKDYRRKARIDGFRPGKVPFGLINRMYRKPALVEEINKILSESLSKFIVDEKLQILGEPMPNEEQKTQYDWDNDTTFEFAFDIGLAPETDITASNKDKFTYYNIEIDDKLRSDYTNNYAQRLGSMKEKEASDESSMIKGDLIEIDTNGTEIENGIRVEDGVISLKVVKSESVSKFTGLKVGDKINVNLKEALPNETDLASLLKTEKDKISSLNGDFSLTVKSVTNFEKAEINQEFYDKLFGKDAIKSEEEFKNKLDEIIKAELKRDSEYKFILDIREYFIKKFKKDLPEKFLKRWLLEVNKEKYTEEQIDKDFDHFVEDLKWQLIKDKIAKDNDLKITEEELQDFAKSYIKMQFFQYYGVPDLPEEQLNSYATEMLKREEERKRLAERKFEEKVIEFIRGAVKIEEKAISLEKFNKLLEK